MIRARILAMAGGLLALGAAACSRPAPDATPEGAVRLWLDRMEQSADDKRAAREAFALLGPSARANLEERAVRASRVHGRTVEPYEMLAEGRFGLRFRPQTMTSAIKGDDAIVEVVGSSADERATVRCHYVAESAGAAAGSGVASAKGWRVEPGLPEPPPLQRREDGGL